MTSEPVTLIIDRRNIITSVGGSWSDAAAEGNAADTLSAEKVIGRSIEEFLGSDVTQMYYDALFKLCRLTAKPITREYRCDSKSHQRYMKLTLTLLDDNAIHMQHETLREIPFEHHVCISDVSKENVSISAYTKRCSICNSLQYPESDQWKLPETLSKEHSLHVKVIHTVCPSCKNINWLESSKLTKNSNLM